ncbi:MAG: fasciclin domain-containing protein [Paraglaciecola sp.]|nr:fasciclin domain-containing protein [Paraglaciecola sp.]
MKSTLLKFISASVVSLSLIAAPAIAGHHNEAKMDIVETAASNSSFTTLVAAVKAAGLVDTLANENETFTVFAPTDAAFDKIPDAVLGALLGDVDALTAVLLQHVVQGAKITSLNAFVMLLIGLVNI